MKKIEVCLSPELLHLFEVKGKSVVIVDILRATSSIVTALAYEVGCIIPVATIDECKKLKESGCIAAAERNGQMVEGFDLGNSPFSYMESHLKGKKIALTTTNGTLALSKSKDAERIVIGAFLNISSIAKFLNSKAEDILIVCAGWKGHANLEDTLFAGALIEILKPNAIIEQDSALLANTSYQQAQKNMFEYLSHSSHFKRLQRLGVEKDILYCLEIDKYQVVPILKGDMLIPAVVEREAVNIPR